MPFEPIRFIHAANLHLDTQLRGLGDCSDDFRRVIETATMTAFERVMDACISERVDFLLLTGNCFNENDQSLPARIALLDGFERLDRKGIRVFVLPGPLDPVHAWQAFSEIPNNVTTFFAPSSAAVAVLRDGKVIASVACTENGELETTHDSTPQADLHAVTGRGPIRVGLCLSNEQSLSSELQRVWRSFDYVAVGGTDQRKTRNYEWGVVHSPGATQAVNSTLSGPHGCTLVEVAADGRLDCRLISTAAVRIENLSLTIDAQSSQTDLINRMRQQLDDRSEQMTESLWMVNWAMAGSGPLYEQLCDDGHSARFIQKLVEELHDTERPPLKVSLRVVPDRAAVGDIVQTQPWTKEYFDALAANIPLTRESLMNCLTKTQSIDDDLVEQLATIVDEVDDRNILGRARQFGIEQFQQAAK